MNLGFYSYLSAAVAYCFFTMLLLFHGWSNKQGKLLTIVIAVSAIWAALASEIARENLEQAVPYQVFEVIRYTAWYIFLLKLFDNADQRQASYKKFVKWALPLGIGFTLLVLVGELFVFSGFSTVGVVAHVVMALAGLAIIEQLLRNTSGRRMWAIKYLFLGAGVSFAFDFYLYADALLFRGVDREIWEVRGFINFIVVPLLAIAAVRNKDWSLNIFVSRDIVLNTTAIFGGGLYLLIMSAAGYYLRDFGGSWGRFGQIVFFTLAVVLLVTVMFSGRLRAKIKVFLGKHFYKNKYDYRVEWLKLTDELTNRAQNEKSYQSVIEALANIIDARAGLLWMADEHGVYRNTAAWHDRMVDATETEQSPLIRFLVNKGYIINVNEIDIRKDEYEDLVLPEWLVGVQHPWLIVPLQGLESLVGFIVLANPLVARSINWEDRDLLITSARQVASYLTVLMKSEALAEAKQFDVFSRLSAYMVHDLKNIVAELEMVSRNSKKHISNPAFVEDAFETVENAADDIKRLLEQLRNKKSITEKISVIDLGELTKEVVSGKQTQLPKPCVEITDESCYVAAEKNRLSNVIAHLIDNAQQATDDNGKVDVKVINNGHMHIVEIRDTGHGMDEDFIRSRLFKAFDTTKGNAGMGIGMYESREFVQQLGGDIHVQSEVGKGSSIALHIPARNQNDQSDTNV